VAKVDFELIRQKVKDADYEISVHASKRLRQRGLTLADLEHIILTGKIIERSPKARPFPKCIFLGFTLLKGEALHVVCSLAPHTLIVTVYFPEEDKWARDQFRRKPKRK